MKDTDKKWRSFASAKLIIAIVAITGFGFTSCGDGGGGGITIESGPPGNAILTRMHLTPSQSTALLGISGYYGYSYFDEGGPGLGLVFLYKGKNEAAFNSVKELLEKSPFNYSMTDYDLPQYNTEFAVRGGNGDSAQTTLSLYTVVFSEAGINFPAGSMMISLETHNPDYH